MSIFFGDQLDPALAATIRKQRWYRHSVYKNSVLRTSAYLPYFTEECFSFEGIEGGIPDMIRVGKEHYLPDATAARLSGALYARISDDPGFLGGYVRRHRDDQAKMLRHAETARLQDHSVLPDDALAAAFRGFFDLAASMTHWWSLGFLGGAMDRTVRERLAAADVGDVDRFIERVSHVGIEHAFQQEPRRILAIGEDALRDTPRLRELHAEYAWLDIDYWDGAPTAFEAYLAHARDVVAERAVHEQKRLEREKGAAIADEAIASIRDPVLRRLLEDMRDLISLRTEEADAWALSWFRVGALIEEVARRLGLSHDDLLRCTGEEILAGLGGRKVASSQLQDRDDAVMMRLGHQVHSLSSVAADGIRAAIQASSRDERTQLRGTSAFAGVARGPARVLLSSDDLPKLRKGDILVSHATNSNYDPGIPLVAGIVTDEGGVLCHSAVIAREFKIPCIVGTKDASQVILDDDLIEVDATKGTVTIIERAAE